MGNWNQDNSSFTDEDMDQSLEQDKAAAAFEASGGNIGGYTFGDNYLGDGNYSPQVTDIATARSNISGLQDFYSGALPQSTYNGIMGITPKNPYGHQGFFSRVLGIDPRNIDYATGPGGLGYKGAAKVAQKKYERYTNWSGQNPQAQKQAFGSLFGNPVDEITVQGPVAQQVDIENIPLNDALVSQGASLALGPLGLGLMSMADPFSTYVPTGSKAYNEQFDPAINKDLPTSFMGQASKRTGLGISALADSIKDYFSPSTPAPTPTQIGSVTPSQYETRADIIARTSQHPLTGETSAAPVPRSSISRSPIQQSTTQEFVRDPAILDALMGGANLPAQSPVTAGEELMAGNQQGFFGFGLGPLGDAFGRSAAEKNLSPEVRDFLNEHDMSVKDLLDKDFSKVPDGARLPSGQIMGPEFRTEQRSSLGGPATANQYAQVDYSNLSNVGGDMYQAGQQKSAFDSFLETFGMKEAGRRPGGQIYSPAGQNKSFFNFDNFGFRQ